MKSQKHLFGLNSNTHYLNCAYKAPLLISAEEAVKKALLKDRNPAAYQSTDFFDDVDVVKLNFAKLVHSDFNSIALMPSTSYGYASVLNNTKAKTKGNAITIQDEFPSGYFALSKWCSTNNNQLIIIKPNDGESQKGESWNDNILKAINDQTSVVLISAIHWMTGLKYDLQQIGEKCKEVGAVFIVDGSQSVGALPMNVEKHHIDALICASYKWLFGPYNLAIAYINKRFHQGTPLEESWMNRSNAKDFTSLTKYDETYMDGAERFSMGEKSSFLSMAVLNEGLTQILNWEVDNIQSYCTDLIRPFKSLLNELSIPMEKEAYFSNHLFSLELPDHINIAKFKEQLKQDQIVISVRGKYIRVSVNVFNEAQNMEALIGVLKNQFI